MVVGVGPMICMLEYEVLVSLFGCFDERLALKNAEPIVMCLPKITRGQSNYPYAYLSELEK